MTARHIFVVIASLLGGGAGLADAPACTPSSFRVVLDVGHTASSPGATSARGETEYAFNLKLARRIERELRDGGFVHTTVLITEGDGRAQLLRRAKRANALAPDLLLSIHHDSVPQSYLETWTHDGVQRSFSDKFSGFSLFMSRDAPKAKASLAFAKLLATELVNRDLRFTLHYADTIRSESRELLDRSLGVYAYDELVVLYKSRMPAVLFEAGLIVNREEELLLASSDRQNITAAAFHAAIATYCERTAAERSRPPRR
jgi:N-acetylmuramoyl-L-alanine amidase